VCHGHVDLPALRRFKGLKVLAHEHPALKLRDPVGAVVSAPAFVFEEGSGTLVVPALSPLAAGADMLRQQARSPPLRRLDRRRFRIFAVSDQGLLDFGTIGLLDAVMEPLPGRRNPEGAGFGV
jgi:metallophosphoesterase superfamily enzyme